MIEQIAKTVHAVHLAYCKEVGETTQPSWDKVSNEHKDVVRNSIIQIINGTVKSSEDSHSIFFQSKLIQGWVYGEYSIELKQNPRLVLFEELKITDRMKEILFFETVKSFM